ncbi:MAG: FxsA family protein [Myxococcales bacterium]|nr:FxsA family protein [Myxococcales bacterium]
MCGLLALLFLIVPALEIYVIIEVGGRLGTLATLVVIAVTAVVGAALAKSQGLAVLTRLQNSTASGEGAGTAIVEGVLVLVAGVTLLAPGFVTDAVGLALLIPPIRSAIAGRLAGRMTVAGPGVMSSIRPDVYGGGGDDDEPPSGVIDV